MLDESEVRTRARRVVEAFAEAIQPLGATVHVYYAAKAFLSADVARWMRDAGLRIDVATGGELALALAAGVPAASMGLHGNDKSDDEIATAVEAGIGSIVLDAAEEVGRVADAARRAGARAGRAPPGEQRRARDHPRVPRHRPRDQKFGIALTPVRGGGVDPGAPRAALLGLHTHIGSQIFGIEGSPRRPPGSSPPPPRCSTTARCPS